MQSTKKFACTICRRRKLRCDGARPSCDTCTRLQHQCEYVEPRKRILNQKRRNMKDLEARLADVEGLLRVNSGPIPPLKKPCPPLRSSNSIPESDVDLKSAFDAADDAENDCGMDDNLDIVLDNTNSPDPILLQPSMEVVQLGLEEPLPSQDIIDELHEIYFEKVHPAIPILHKCRYLASTRLASHLAPAIFLRYAIWAVAASMSERYAQYEATFYQRARKYAQADEMRDNGRSLMSVDHVRFWVLMGDFESRKMYFHRAWSSLGRSVRLAQMIGLHRVDEDDGVIGGNLSPSERIDLEERRRIFWAAFIMDRYSSCVTGWPMAIDEKEILTNLPTTEEAFEKGEFQATMPLSAVIDAETLSDVSPFAGIAVMAGLFGRLVIHLHQPNQANHYQDLANGEFWKRHRKLDGLFTHLLMLLPNNLRLSSGINDPNVIFLHLNLHALIVALHHAAVAKAEMHSLDESLIRQIQSRSNAAAEEIIRVLRLASHINLQKMHSFLSFCLHMTVGTFIKSGKDPLHEYQSRRNLEILLAILRSFKPKGPVLQMVISQIRSSLQGNSGNSYPPPSETNGKWDGRVPSSAISTRTTESLGHGDTATSCNDTSPNPVSTRNSDSSNSVTESQPTEALANANAMCPALDISNQYSSTDDETLISGTGLPSPRSNDINVVPFTNETRHLPYGDVQHMLQQHPLQDQAEFINQYPIRISHDLPSTNFDNVTGPNWQLNPRPVVNSSQSSQPILFEQDDLLRSGNFEELIFWE